MAGGHTPEPGATRIPGSGETQSPGAARIPGSGETQSPGAARIPGSGEARSPGLGIDDDELATCVGCGLCLPHCPTYRVTGEEALSPRGRVAAMRQVQWQGVAVDDSFVRSIETCVQCRGCETACPSGVPFGHLIEPARASLTQAPGAAGRPPLALRLAVRALRHHRLVLAGSTLLALAQRLRLVPASLARRSGLPARLPVRRPRRRPSGTAGSADVWLFTGCVMDAWMRDVHTDVQRTLEAAGARVALPGHRAACCGALAQHAGLAAEARAQAGRTLAAFPGEAPILVDSAGCGAMLKDYGRLLGTPEARAFSARVLDVHEWLAERVDDLVASRPETADVGPEGPGTAPSAGPEAEGPGTARSAGPEAEGPGTARSAGPEAEGPRAACETGPGRGPARPGGERPVVAVQDPCHLRHAQRCHTAVREVLAPFATLVELDDDGLCCGAGGAYAAVQPELAGDIRDRKVAAIERTGAPLVASANPGCALHLTAAGLTVLHPCQIVARALDTPSPTGPAPPPPGPAPGT